MLIHPDLLMVLTNDHNRELLADADRGRVLTTARRARRARRAGKAQAVRGHPTGNLASCEPSAVVPAR